MKLKKVRIKEYRSIIDSGEFSTDDITCLVGKNEAGKTAVLKAIYSLNPIVEGEGNLDVTDDYPRRDVEDYKQDVSSGKRKEAEVICATFELDEAEMRGIKEEFGPDCAPVDVFSLSKYYGNNKTFSFRIDDELALKHLVETAELSGPLQKKLQPAKTAEAILEKLNALDASDQTTHITTLKATLEKIQERGVNGYVYAKYLKPRLPRFLYFDEYYQMRGHENIEALQQRQDSNTLQPSDHPLLGLIKLARLALDSLINPDRTQDLTNKLEGAGNHLTKQIVTYWSQNKHIQMRFDVRPARPSDPVGMTAGTNIWANIYDSRHWVTTGVGTRSRGFVWFFSFLSWYSQIKQEANPVILLLDEPGLSLHAKAQEDLLKYFESEIKGNNQLIYSTHSPFMVDPNNFQRVRIVQDVGIDSDEVLPAEEDGTKVFAEVFHATKDSLFPLQGALGYEIYQTLFVGPNNLIVEGVSDLLYLTTISDILVKKKRVGLDSRWTITPVGGSEKVSTFVALLGNQKGLKIATLIDVQKKDKQTIENLYEKKLLARQNVLTLADFTGAKEADIEDMFEEAFYLSLVNGEFKNDLARTLTSKNLNPKIPRVLRRIEEELAQRPLKNKATFGHFRPARYFVENISALESKLSDVALSRFEKAFKRLNGLL